MCSFVYVNTDYVPDGTKGEQYIKCKFGNDADMTKADGVLHKYAKVFLPFTHFNGMPERINKSLAILNNHRDELMKMSNDDVNVEWWKHFSDDTYYQNLGARISKIIGGNDWEQSFGDDMVKKRKDVTKELEEKKEEYDKTVEEAQQLGTPKKGNISKRKRVR